MKILHLCNKVPFPGRDGSSLAMEALIRVESRLGHEVHVLALNTEKHWVDATPPALDGVVLEALAVRTAPSLLGALGNLLKTASYYASRFYQPSVARRVAELAPTADVVVLDSLFMAVYLDELGGTPVVLRAHNVEHAIWMRGLADEPGLRRAYVRLQAQRLRRWEARVAASVDQVWAITAEDAAWFRHHRTAGVSVLPCSWDPEGSWSFSGAESDQAYHLGALDWTPNIRGMAWFIDRVAPKLERATLHVFSRQWPFAAPPVQVAYSAEPLADFSAYGIFAAPIRSGSGMRIKLLEAMARGKAVVTTPLGAEGLGATDGTHLILAETAEEFAAALDRLAGHRELRVALGLAAAEHARQMFTDDRAAAVVAAELATFAG
ncbi:MAG: hypothetical protein RIR07_745 [Bacteroidota bacterium]